MASVELAGIRKAYGKLVVADGIDLSIAHGELVCLLGPSGCGKTTTLRLIAGFMTPDAGIITVGGKVISRPGTAVPPEQRSMSMIFQSYALWPHMSVADNIAYGLRLRRLSNGEIARKLDAILAVTRLAPLRARFPGELSGGQQQRVALARALVVEPETLLLDEPLSNLDTNLREEMRFEIQRLHDEFRYTTVYVTHDQMEAMTTADRIVVMNLGRIEQMGAPEDIYLRPTSEFVARFIGGTNILRGRATDGHIVCGGQALRYGSGTPAELADTAVSVRAHDIALLPAGSTGGNIFPATVVRHTYLGAQHDYLLDSPGLPQMRVTTPLHIRHAPGDAIAMHLPAEHCRALAR